MADNTTISGSTYQKSGRTWDITRMNALIWEDAMNENGQLKKTLQKWKQKTKKSVWAGHSDSKFENSEDSASSSSDDELIIINNEEVYCVYILNFSLY